MTFDAADPMQCSIDSIVGRWRVSAGAYCVCRDSAVLRQVLRQINQLITVELRRNLREFCVIESCVVMHCGAD